MPPKKKDEEEEPQEEEKDLMEKELVISYLKMQLASCAPSANAISCGTYCQTFCFILRMYHGRLCTSCGHLELMRTLKRALTCTTRSVLHQMRCTKVLPIHA